MVGVLPHSLRARQAWRTAAACVPHAPPLLVLRSPSLARSAASGGAPHPPPPHAQRHLGEDLAQPLPRHRSPPRPKLPPRPPPRPLRRERGCRPSPRRSLQQSPPSLSPPRPSPGRGAPGWGQGQGWGGTLSLRPLLGVAQPRPNPLDQPVRSTRAKLSDLSSAYLARPVGAQHEGRVAQAVHDLPKEGTAHDADSAPLRTEGEGRTGGQADQIV